MQNKQGTKNHILASNLDLPRFEPKNVAHAQEIHRFGVPPFGLTLYARSVPQKTMPEMANFTLFSQFLIFPTKTPASIITGALTYANERRYTTMKSEHEKYAAAQLTHGDLFPSFTLIVGANLTRKLVTFYGSVLTVHDVDALLHDALPISTRD